MFQLTKVSSRVRKYHLEKLFTLILVSEKNQKFWETIFHWLNQSENRVTFTWKTRTLGMYAEEFILVPRQNMLQMKKLHHNLKSFIIH